MGVQLAGNVLTVRLTSANSYNEVFTELSRWFTGGVPNMDLATFACALVLTQISNPDGEEPFLLLKVHHAYLEFLGLGF
jgi:hypothetical protein